VATVTLRAKTLPYWLCQLSTFVAPGSGPVFRVIAFGWAGIAIGVILSFCAEAGEASSQAIAKPVARTPARPPLLPKNPISFSLPIVCCSTACGAARLYSYKFWSACHGDC